METLTPPRPLNVLVADDYAANRAALKALLEVLGHRADAVTDGRSAVEAASSGDYDLVLMDLQMPGMDGFEAARRLRSRRAPDDAPRIIAQSAETGHDQAVRCRASGMDDVLTKPVRLRDLAAVLVRWFPDGPGGGAPC